MQVRMSITNKLILGMLGLSFFVTIFVMGPALYLMDNYIGQSAQNAAVGGMEGLEHLLETRKQSAMNFAEMIAANPKVVQFVAAEDTENVLATVGALAKRTDIDFITITNKDGRVIGRTHAPEQKGDMVTNQDNVVSALKGEALAAVESGTAVKLSARAGAPVKDEQGQVIGVISAGYDVSNGKLLDFAKEMFHTDMTLFLNDVRVATTVMKDGERVVGTKLDPKIADIVLNQNKAYQGKTNILDMPYYTSYMPLLGADKQIIGVVFSGQKMEESIAARNQLLYLVGGIWLGITLLAFFVIVYLSKRFLQPIKDLIKGTEQVATGDLTRMIQVDSQDEFGILADQFNHMIVRLKKLLGQAHAAEEKLVAAAGDIHLRTNESAQASEQVSQSIVEVAGAAQKQLSSVITTSKNVDVMSSEVDAAMEKSQQVVMVSDQTAASAHAGNRIVEQAIKQMTSIEQAVDNMGKAVMILDGQSKEIGKITNAIVDIAGQTNLLALNAAVEAARAGTHGRGFAVVAEEIRKLAEASALSAENIGTLIRQIQEETQSTVAEMQKGMEEVHSGTEVFSQAGKAFGDIMQHSESVLQGVASVVANIKALAQSREHVVQEIKDIEILSQSVSSQTETISAATEEQTASMSEMASHSQNLMDTAEGLKKAISQFKM
jgi:methyl-accepting chemotaxis protein